MDVRFVSTEAGLRLLRATLRNYLMASRLSALQIGRIQHTSLGTSDPRDLALHAGFLRLVSVTEATLDSLAVELTERSVPNTDEVVRLLMLEKELAAQTTWEARRRVFKRHHHVDIRRCDEYDRVEGAIEARNAIAHGLGRLTTRQVQSQETAKRLARVGVATVNRWIALRREHLEQCSDYTAAFLRSVDRSLS